MHASWTVRAFYISRKPFALHKGNHIHGLLGCVACFLDNKSISHQQKRFFLHKGTHILCELSSLLLHSAARLLCADPALVHSCPASCMLTLRLCHTHNASDKHARHCKFLNPNSCHRRLGCQTSNALYAGLRNLIIVFKCRPKASKKNMKSCSLADDGSAAIIITG